MTLSYPSRKDARTDLAAKITNSVTGFQVVYAYPPSDIGGQSPVCIIESGGAQYAHTPSTPHTLRFAIGAWVRWGDESGDREDAADLLDDLAADLAATIHSNYNARFYQPSDIDAIEITDGVVYMYEIHYLEVLWW